MIIGVVLTTAIILAIVLIALELRVVYSSDMLKKLVKRGPLYGIAFSLILAFVIGAIFGAGGLVVMVAGLIAMTATETVHSFNRSTAGIKSKAQKNIAEFKATYRPIGILIKWILLVLTSPIWLPIKIRRVYHKFTETDYAKAS